jgi:hypothetical protein
MLGKQTKTSAATHFCAKQSGESPLAKPVIAEATQECCGITQKIVCLLGLADPGPWKQRCKAAGLRQVFPAGEPIMFAIAVTTLMKRVAVGDTHETAARIPEFHPAVLVESGHAGQSLVRKPAAYPFANDLFRLSQLFLEIHPSSCLTPLPRC